MAGSAHVVLVAGRSDAWSEVTAKLSGEGFSFERIDLALEPAEVASRARAGESLIVADLSLDLLRGIEIVSACRRLAPQAPLIVVAQSPSLDLSRSIRASGVFYLAVHPVTVDEMRTVLEDALRSIGRKKPSASQYRTKKRVLVVDDDGDFLASVTALLQNEGCAVVCAKSAREGLRQIDSERPDLIILDIMMEDDWAGYAMNQALKYGDRQQAAGQVPILMVSSIQQPPQAVFPTAGEAAMITPDMYMTKPLDIPVFLENIRRLLAGRGPRGQAP